jgi:hypothetical protein
MPLNKMPEFDQYDILLINDMIHSIVRAQGCSFRGLWVILGLRKGTLIGLTRVLYTEDAIDHLNSIIDLKRLNVLIL